MQFAEMIVCLLAVFGIYALLCRVLAFFCRKEGLSVAVYIEDGEELATDVGDRMRDAILITESKNGRLMPPVILLKERPNEEAARHLRGYGYPIYYRDSENM